MTYKKDVIGIDIGGTKTNIGFIAPDGKIIESKIIATNSHNPEELKNDLIKEINLIKGKEKMLKGIGIASAGRIHYSRKKILYTTSNLKGWSNVDIVNILNHEFQCPVFIDNDVNAALLSELLLNKSINGNIVIYLTIGTGLGGAISIDNNIIRGNSGSVGEFGHMILYPNGIKCNCGKKGCAEQYISGTAYRKKLINALELNGEINKEDLSIAFIQKNIFSGKNPYLKTLEEMSEDLAILIDNLKNALDFDTCVIGGGFHIYQDIILDILNKIFSLKKYDYMKTPSILFSTQGNNSGLIGAGLLVHNNIEMKKS